MGDGNDDSDVNIGGDDNNTVNDYNDDSQQQQFNDYQ